MARGGLKTPEPGRVTGRVGDGVGVSEADGGRGYSTLHCTGVMRSRERGKEESGGGEDEKQDKALRLSRGFTTHVWSAADVVCGLWCAGGRRVWVEMGLGLLLLSYDAIHGWTR